ncbi:MAG: hypothetical protein IJK60_09510 [Clostridia bacterium]|nr:hypothetical protein [Clostridia bacterium]
MKRFINVFLALSFVLSVMFLFASCGSNVKGKGTITVEGVIADNNGQSAEGLTLVLLDESGNDYSVKIEEGGKFTANGILPDTELALSVEDDNGRGLTKISYFKIITSDSVSLGEMQGKNFNGYLSACCKEETEKLYISFHLDENNYLAIGYISDECPESETVTATEKTEKAKETVTRNDVLF